MSSNNVRKSVRIVMPFLVGLLTIPVAAQSILYVDAKAPAGGNGQSWVTAYRHLQDALAAAVAWGSGVTEVRVAAGVYKPDQGQGFTPGDRYASFNLINGVAIRGGYAGIGRPDPDARDVKLNEAILSGDLLGDDGPAFANNSENSRIVVTANGVQNSAVLDGFTVTGGNALEYGGGGICVLGPSSPILMNLVIRNNRSVSSGGGIMVNYVGAQLARPLIVNCVIAENSAQAGGGACGLGGTAPQFINCFFLANSVSGRGGGVRSFQSQATFTNCVFAGNTALIGGAISVEEPGVDQEPLGRTTIRNCTLVQNHTTYQGGAIDILNGGRADLLNCIVWDNTGPGALESNQIRLGQGQLEVAHSSVQGWTGLFGGIANDGNDPLFTHPEGPDGLAGTLDDNVRPRSDSLCVDTGNNDYLPNDRGDLDGDGDRTERLPLDLDGAPRLVGASVDRGAYESNDCNANGISDILDLLEGTSTDCNQDGVPDECQPEVCPCRAPGDLDCDNDVDQSDFGKLQACLAGATIIPTGSACKAADINNDNHVDIVDVLLFKECMTGPGEPAKRDCAG